MQNFLSTCYTLVVALVLLKYEFGRGLNGDSMYKHISMYTKYELVHNSGQARPDVMACRCPRCS